MKKLIVMLALALCCLLLTPALASASKPTLKSLAKSLAALQTKVKKQGTSIASLKSDLASAKQTIVNLRNVVGADSSHGLRKSVADIAANPALTLSWLPTYLSLDANPENGVAGPNIVFKGANVHVMSSTSETDSSGLGNLIVGWNLAPVGGTFRGGSNNLVCGNSNNFSSYGGFVAGSANSVSGTCCSVSGGDASTASGDYSSVSGGHHNVASGSGSTVTGGGANLASELRSSISGGWSNAATASYATVGGGDSMSADLQDGWVAKGTLTAP